MNNPTQNILQILNQHQNWMRHEDLLTKFEQIENEGRTYKDSFRILAIRIEQCVMQKIIDRKIEYTDKKGNPIIFYRVHPTIPPAEIKKQILETLTELIQSEKFHQLSFAQLYIRSVTPKISYCSVRHDNEALLHACISISDESLLGRLNELIERGKKESVF